MIGSFLSHQIATWSMQRPMNHEKSLGNHTIGPLDCTKPGRKCPLAHACVCGPYEWAWVPNGLARTHLASPSVRLTACCRAGPKLTPTCTGPWAPLVARGPCHSLLALPRTYLLHLDFVWVVLGLVGFHSSS